MGAREEGADSLFSIKYMGGGGGLVLCLALNTSGWGGV